MCKPSVKASAADVRPAYSFVLLFWYLTITFFKDTLTCIYIILNCSFAFGPALLSLAGFFMGVLWIDALASEVCCVNICIYAPVYVFVHVCVSLDDFFNFA